jgi:ClpP class serine protease
MSTALAAALAEPWMIEPESFRTITTIADRGQLPPDFQKLIAGTGPDAVASRPGEPLKTGKRATVREGVATIPIRGPITRHASMFSDVCGMTSTANIAHDFQAAIDSPAVRAIILEFDSPGGQATGIADLADLIFASRGVKPIKAFVEGASCSAAYYLSAACDECIAGSMSMLGSIGVIWGISPKTKRPGDPIDFISSDSPMKRADPETAEGYAEFQRMVDELAAVFLADVAKFRGVSVETVKAEFGRGGSKIGESARVAGMADRIGTYEALHRQLADGRPSPQPAPSKPTNLTPGATAPIQTKGPTTMWKRIWGKTDDKGAVTAFSETEPAEVVATAPTPKPEAAASLEDHPAFKAMQAQLAELKKPAAAAINPAGFELAAKTWADAQLAANRILPAEVVDLSAGYAQAAIDDATSPREGKSRVELYTAPVEARKPHALTSESAVNLTADARVIPNVPGFEGKAPAHEPTAAGEPMSAERRARLLSLTENGQAALTAAARLAK